ncbi:MAG TPA: HAD family hydrolase, partial [Paracoccaceae bacterium]|nr:HAD family hydrolase [Paracoccaceae bacterium]
FDKDGTLFDFRRSWGDWAARLVRELAADEGGAHRLAQAIGYDLRSGDFHPESPVIAATADDIAEALVPHLPGTGRAALAARMNALAEITPMAEAVPLAPTLGALRDRGLRLGLATNDTEAPARAHLAAHGVAHLFDFVAGCDSGHGAKPGPGMLLAFAHRTGLSPTRVVMVGDSRHDLMAGRAAGMRTVAVLTGIAGADELAPLADAVLPDIGRLGLWLDAQGS